MEPLLNDIDVFLRSASTYISVVGFPAASGNNSINALGTDRAGGGSNCKLGDARCCFGTNFTTCLSFNENLDFPEATTRGERRYVNVCRQYIKENPSIKTLKGVKIKVTKALDAATSGSATAAAPAAAASAGKDKVITPVIDMSMLRNLLGDDEIGDEDDFNKWIREQDGSFQGINALIDSPVALVAEHAASPDGAEPDVPPAIFKPSDSEGSGGTSGSTSFESGTDWDQRLAEHTLPRSMVSRTAWSACMRLQPPATLLAWPLPPKRRRSVSRMKPGLRSSTSRSPS